MGKIMSFSEFLRSQVCISDISAILQHPSWRAISHTNSTGRLGNGLIIIKSGECIYTWNGGRSHLKNGSVIYLPLGSKHKVKVITEEIAFYRIDFNITDLTDKTQILFSKGPLLLMHNCGADLFDAADSLVESTVTENEIFKSTSMLYKIFHIIYNHRKVTPQNKIYPAIEYINSHYSEAISIEKLAGLCGVSRAQLFRLFKAQLGETPIEYYNGRRIKRAKKLLLVRETPVKEIAAMLGFENAYYFSRMFRKYTGLSPTEYRQNDYYRPQKNEANDDL